MKDFGPIMRGLADCSLRSVFAAEWVKLDEEGQRLVRQDFLETNDCPAGEGVSVFAYFRRIGEGNLESYAATMKARLRCGWDK
jgi:hypothetical protein